MPALAAQMATSSSTSSAEAALVRSPGQPWRSFSGGRSAAASTLSRRASTSWGQGTGPARVGGRQDERRWDLGMATVQLQRHRAAPRQAKDVWPLDPDHLEPCRQTIGIVGHPPGLRRLRGLAAAWRVPGEHPELVGEPLKLPPPRPAVIHPAMKEHQWPAGAGHRVRDSHTVDQGLWHRSSLLAHGGSRVGSEVGQSGARMRGGLIRGLAGSGQQQPGCCTTGSSRRVPVATAAAAVASGGLVALMMAECRPSPT